MLSSVRTEERVFDGSARGVRLHRRSVQPGAGQPVWARLGVLHGYGEHSGRHLPVMRWLAARGVACHAIDFRGHGLASGRRGYVTRWGEFADDLAAFLRELPVPDEHVSPAPPLFLLGQSHGGLVLAASVVRDRLPADGPPVAGSILSAPYFGSLLKVSRGQLFMAQVADRVLPWLPVRTHFQADWLFDDAPLRAEDAADTLSNQIATPRWYLSTRIAQADVLARAANFRLPLLLLTGEDDPVADPAAALRFFEAAGSGDKTWRAYPGLRHEPLRDARREAVFEDLLRWLRERV